MRKLTLPLIAALLVTSVAAVTTADASEPTCMVWDSGAEAATAEAEVCEEEGEARAIGFNAFEPTMGVTPEGGLYIATTPARGVAAGWRAGVAKAESLDAALAGEAWTDVQPSILGYSNPPETNDPYAYVDPSTGRIFSFHMSPILFCSIMSFSDDGGATWTTPPVGCGPSGAWDHQTMVAAPPTPGVTTIGYPNVLVQCVNAITAEMCARSLDGGLTWGAGYPAYVNPNLTSLCGTQTGHLAADKDGVIYLPTPHCGDRAAVAISYDSGLTWKESVIDSRAMPFTDPAVDFDSAGVMHATWIDARYQLLYATSLDKGSTWSAPVTVTPPGVFAEMPALVAGDEGSIAIAFIATQDLPNGQYVAGMPASEVRWGGYMATATDATDGTPTFTTINATGADDPIFVGQDCSSRCKYVVDFIDVMLTPDGRPVGVFSDGCTNDACKSGQTGNNVTDRGMGIITTVPFDLCAEVCHVYTPAGEVSTNTVVASHQAATHRPFVFSNELGAEQFRSSLDAHLQSLR